MKRNIHILIAALLIISARPVMAMQGHGGGDGHSDNGGNMSVGGTFKHEAVADTIKAEFQVMSLESMNMKSPEGHTHHVMVKLFAEGSQTQIKNAAGKVKIISPSKKEFTATLKDYSGIFAANFTVDEPGKYGVICLLKVNGKKPLYKFWYHHM